MKNLMTVVALGALFAGCGGLTEDNYADKSWTNLNL